MRYPTITAVMVTTGRLNLIHESYNFFKKQTYPEKKLLIVTDCDKPTYTALKQLSHVDKRVSILYVNKNVGKLSLGALRNLSLDYATSDLSCQFDDDDICSSDRLIRQYNGLKNAKAVMLTEQLHYFRDTNQVALISDPTGVEGTLLLDRRCGLTYPDKKKGEDTLLKVNLRDRGLLNCVPGGLCYCRVYHGSNTWDRTHHIQRVKRLSIPITAEELTAVAVYYGWKTGWTVLQ